MYWHPRRAAFHRIVGADLGKEENRILRTIDRAGRITREKLLHAVSWRVSARLLDHLLDRLRSQNYIAIDADGQISVI